MKIDHRIQWSPPAESPAARPGPAAGCPSFSNVLDSLGRSASTEEPLATTAVTGAHRAEESAALAGLEDCLDRLDDYRERLAQPCFSLRDLEPLVESLETGLPALADQCAALPDDCGLRPLIQETMVLSATETARFRRGDYLDA